MNKAICEVAAEENQVTPKETEMMQRFFALSPGQQDEVMQAMQVEMMRVNARQAAQIQA